MSTKKPSSSFFFGRLLSFLPQSDENVVETDTNRDYEPSFTIARILGEEAEFIDRVKSRRGSIDKITTKGVQFDDVILYSSNATLMCMDSSGKACDLTPKSCEYSYSPTCSCTHTVNSDGTYRIGFTCQVDVPCTLSVQVDGRPVAHVPIKHPQLASTFVVTPLTKGVHFVELLGVGMGEYKSIEIQRI